MNIIQPLTNSIPALATVNRGFIGYWRKVFAIVGKDVATEIRAKEMIGAMTVFSMLILFIFNFTFDLRTENLQAVAPGVLWAAITFAGVLGLGRSFVLERDRGVLDGLLLAPMDRSAIYLGKMMGNILFISLVEIIILPVFIILFNQPATTLLCLSGVVFLGTIGFAATGTLFSAMAVHARARELFLPIMLFPVIIPLILADVRLTSAILDRTPFADVNHWLALLIAFDVIFIAVSFMLFEYVVEE